MTIKIVKIVLAILLSVCLGYLLLNAKAVYKLVKYAINPESLENPSELLEIKKIAVEVPSASVTPSTITHTSSEETNFELQANWFSYPRLGISAPVFWKVSTFESNKKMNFGLTHIINTSAPGDGGEGLISGHSSNYWWERGDYNEVFINLPKAQIGDRFIINRNGIKVYEVDKKYEIATNNYLEFSPTGSERMKLMTCVPIGTSLRRLIVEGKLINSL